jgi:hypothetical protein
MDLENALRAEIEGLRPLLEAAAPEIVRPRGWAARLSRLLCGVLF